MAEEYINLGIVERLNGEIEYVDPTEGPFTLDDLKINKKDIEGFLKRQKDAPKGFANQMLTDMANPFFTQYGEPKTLTGLGTLSSLEAIKDQLISQAIRIEEQKKISKKAGKAPSYLSLMSPRNVINEANNITEGYIEPVGMGEGPITPVDKKTDPKTLVGPVNYLDYLKSVTPFTDEIQKVRYEKGRLLSLFPSAEITVGAPGGSVASGFNLRGLASFGNEFLTQKVIAKAKKMSTKQGAEFIDEFIKAKNIDVNKLPQKQKDVDRLLENNPKNVPLIKVNQLGVQEELAKLEVEQTGPADVTQANVASYMSEYSEGFGTGATSTEKTTKSFRILNSETGVGYKAKNVDTPFNTTGQSYLHPQVLEMGGETGKAQYEPIYGHSRSLLLRELGPNDVHPSLKGTGFVLTGSKSFNKLAFYREDFEFYQRSNMSDPNKPPIIRTNAGQELEIVGPKDIDVNNYGIEDKNLMDIFPNIDLPENLKGTIPEKAISDKFGLLLDFRISMQKLRAILAQFTEIPTLTTITGPNKTRYGAADYYTFEDIISLLKNIDSTEELKNIETYITNYAKIAILNSLEPNRFGAATLYSAVAPDGKTYTSVLGKVRGLEGKNPLELNRLMMEKINFKNPLSHVEIHNLVTTLAKIEAQRAITKNKDSKINIPQEAGKLLAEDKTSDALINLLKHEELGGEKLLSLYKQANTNEDMRKQPFHTPGVLISHGELRNKIQEAEKNWGNGKTIIRFAEEQYDTFKPNKAFLDSRQMIDQMTYLKNISVEKAREAYDLEEYLTDKTPKEGRPERKTISIASKAFARMMDKPEQLVELTTLHNIKKAIEGGFDKVQFNTFSTQAKLSNWIDFSGRPEDLEKYYFSPLENNATAADAALFKILNFRTENPFVKALQDSTSKFVRDVSFSRREFDAPKGGLSANENVKEYIKLNKQYDLDKKISQLIKDAPQEIKEEINKLIIKGLLYLDDTSFLVRSGIMDVNEYNKIITDNTGQYGTVFGTARKDIQEFLKKDVNLAEKFFSDGVNKVVYKEREGVVGKLIRGIKEGPRLRNPVSSTGYPVTITNPIWVTTVKRALLDSFFMLPKTENPMSYVQKLSENVFYGKYGHPSDKALADGIVGAKNDRGELRYARLRDQYDKNKMKTLEKMGLNYELVKDGKPSSPMTFIEVNLGNNKKEKLELLEKLNNYEVKLYSSANPLPSFNEVKEEEKEDPMALDST